MEERKVTLSDSEIDFLVEVLNEYTGAYVVIGMTAEACLTVKLKKKLLEARTV